MNFPKFLKLTVVLEYQQMENGTEEIVIRNTDKELAEILSTALRFYELIISMNGQYGGLKENGSFSGVIGMLQR